MLDHAHRIGRKPRPVKPAASGSPGMTRSYTALRPMDARDWDRIRRAVHKQAATRAEVKTERRSNEEIEAHHGSDFVMFGSLRDARDFDHEKYAEARSLSTFLDALYIPQRLRDPLSLFHLPRTKVGNRVNPVILAWDRAEAGHKVHRLRKWVHVRRREAQEQVLSFRNVLVMATVFVLLVCCGLGLQRSVKIGDELPGPLSFNVASSATAGKRSPVIAPPLIVHDEIGNVVKVRAADPRSVLLGFCQGMASGMCEPMELAWSDPPHPQVRFGVFRSFYDIRAIEIRRDPRTNQWGAGDGNRPVSDFVAHDRRMSANRVPVEPVSSLGRGSD